MVREGEQTTEIEFFVKGRPRSKGSFVFSRGRIFPQNSKGLYKWTKQIRVSAPLRVDADSNFKLTEAVVSMQIDFYFARTKAEQKRRYFNKAPDLDKLIRAVLDALTGVIYKDDSQVVAIFSTKQYTDITHKDEGCYIRLSF